MALARNWPPKNKYEYVIIGSGYGGSITAARLAGSPGNPSVCLLERGREWEVGKFPDSLPEVLREQRSHINPDGLYEFLRYDDISVVKGNGLGGTSLINANVAIVPDEELFSSAGWPSALTLSELLPYYQKARHELNVKVHPRAGELLKVQALDRRAQQVGRDAFGLDLAVTFTDGPNAQGFFQPACIDCGDCVTGCNVGSKNTLYMNYLPLARDRGAEIYVQTKVESIEKLADGRWKIHGEHLDGRPGKSRFTMEADNVILSAGSINTPEILLRSAHSRKLRLSPLVGSQFSGNGDFFGLAYNGDFQTNILGFGNHPNDPRRRQAPGPTIVGAIRYKEGVPLFDRVTVQDLTVPRAYVEAVKAGLTLIKADDTDLGDEDTEALRRNLDVWRRAQSDQEGALNHTMVYLVMAFDDARGSFVFEAPFHEPDGKVRIEWDDAGRQPVFEKINHELREHARALGAGFIPNPLWALFDQRQLITAHPLGGCPIGEDYLSGAVDEFGRVFSADGEVHRGLFVADGSLIPSALGLNPYLTISAISERIAHHMLRARAGQAYPEPPKAVSMAGADPRKFLDFRESQLERVFLTSESLPIEVMANQGGIEVDVEAGLIRNDTWWKGFFAEGHVLNEISERLFTGFRKRFYQENGQWRGMTTDSDGNIRARNTLEELNLTERTGDLNPGRHILLRYTEAQWRGFYDVFKVINENLLIGRVYLGHYPHGRRLFTFPMLRRYGLEEATLADHKHLWNLAAVPTPRQLEGVWRMQIFSNANHMENTAYLAFDLKPDGRLEARYQLMGLIEGFTVTSLMDTHFRMDDFTPFHDEIRILDDDLMIGRWITDIPEFLPLTSLGILHVTEENGQRLFGFHYLLTKADSPRIPASRLLQGLLDLRLPASLGLHQEEEMEGWYFPGQPLGGDSRAHHMAIRNRIPDHGDPAGGFPCRFRIDIRTNSIDGFIASFDHTMYAIGEMWFAEFEGAAPIGMSVNPGSTFQVAVVNEETEEAEMRYRLLFQTHDGRQFALVGRKFLESNRGGGLRQATEIMEDYTTFYGRVIELSADNADKGAVYLKFRTFEDLAAVKNLTRFLGSYNVTGTRDPILKLRASMKYAVWMGQFLAYEYSPLGFGT